MAMPNLKIVWRDTSAMAARRRLQASPLAKRRLLETHETKQRAKLAAQWYLSAQYKPRYWTEDT